MPRRYDLDEMRREIAEDEGTTVKSSEVALSQEDILKMMQSKKKRAKPGDESNDQPG